MFSPFRTRNGGVIIATAGTPISHASRRAINRVRSRPALVAVVFGTNNALLAVRSARRDYFAVTTQQVPGFRW